MNADPQPSELEHKVVSAARRWAAEQRRKIDSGDYSRPFAGDAEDVLLRAVTRLVKKAKRPAVGRRVSR